MKTITFPPLRVTPELLEAAKDILLEDEFVARGFASREKARESGHYVGADVIIERLKQMMASAKSGK